MKSATYNPIAQYVLTTFVAIFILACIRVVEFYIIQHYDIQYITANILYQNSINLDTYFAIAFSVLLLIPFVIASLKFPLASLLVYKVLWMLLIIINLCLTHFFISGGYLLTNIVFQFSFDEIWHIVMIESSSKLYLIWLLYLTIPISIWLLFFQPSLLRARKWLLAGIAGLYLLLATMVGINFRYYYKPVYKFTSQFEFYISNCKITYFCLSIIHAHESNDALTKKQLYAAIEKYHKAFPEFHFTSVEYPFLHNENYTNVLGKYFNTSTTPPNIVFIVSEGLASSFAGMHPTTQHLLPFVDSLAANGLYWENFLSNCSRTYGVLSNVFGSLTTGTLERGFANFDGKNIYGKRYPEHNSLIKELKLNNYFTSFTYGGWGEFDNYKNFLAYQKTDLITVSSNFDSVKYVAPWNRLPKGFYWGYDDKALFNQWFDYLDSGKIGRPFLSIFMTLNMHEPYNMCPPAYYDNAFIAARLKKLKLGNSVFKQKSNEILGSLFFYEDALKAFFDNYKKRDDYNNTIFIIFGDHFSITSFLNSPVGIYHVPCIIYSPLLKEHAVFKGVSTHTDIVPSLIALLQGNFGLHFTSEKQWIGGGLDTSKTFRCNRVAPFNLYHSDRPNFIYHNYFCMPDAVLKITNDLNTEVVSDTAIIQSINDFIRNFKAIDTYVCNKDKIWPY